MSDKPKFIIEKQWTTAIGHRAIVIICLDYRDQSHRHRCGYVEVSHTSPLKAKSYDDLPSVEVHGGLTFSNNDHPIKTDGWWFGFDCAHGYDAPINGKDRMFPEATVKSLEFCELECERLAVQLDKLEHSRA